MNLSRKCAVVKDDVASIQIYNCNVALTVNFARADQSFLDVCLPALESHSTPIFGRSLHAQAATVAMSWIRILVLMLTLFSCRSCHHLSLSCISCLLCQSCPPPSDLKCSFCSNCLECELTSAGFNVCLNFPSNLLVRDQSCTVHGKMLFQLTRNEGFKCSCLDVFIKRCSRRSAGLAPFVSANQFLPLLKSGGKILQFAPVWTKNCRSRALRMPPLRGSQRRTNCRSPSRPYGAALRTMSQLSLLFFPGHRQPILHQADRTIVPVRCS